MNIRAYTVVDVRTDLLAHQARSIQKFSLEHMELVVLDNTPSKRKSLRPEIERICTEHGLRRVMIPEEVQNHKTPNDAHAEALKWAWTNVVMKDDPMYAVLLDFDMFFCAPFAVSTYMMTSDVAGWAQGPGGTYYIWPGLMILSLAELPDPHTIDLGCGKIGDVHVDVGGQFHNYLKAHPEVKVKGMDSSNRRFEDTITMLPEPARADYRDFMAPHEQKHGIDFFVHNTFLHYVGATGWNYPPEDLTTRKTAWLLNLLDRLMDGSWVMP